MYEQFQNIVKMGMISGFRTDFMSKARESGRVKFQVGLV
jgi:hypothetical protein